MCRDIERECREIVSVKIEGVFIEGKSSGVARGGAMGAAKLGIYLKNWKGKSILRPEGLQKFLGGLQERLN